jgi:N-sulfoglucosamine sulfohydrolase
MISWVDIAPTILDYAGALSSQIKMHGRSILPVLGRTHAPDWSVIYASHTFHEVTTYYPMRVVRDRRYKLIWNVAHELEFPLASDLWNSATWQYTVGAENGGRLGKRSIRDFLRRPRFELYDLQEDPDEVVNLAADHAHRDLLNRMVASLKTFQRQTKDPWAVKWTHE